MGWRTFGWYGNFEQAIGYLQAGRQVALIIADPGEIGF